jgi:quinol monooxygenase YgiN
MVLYVMKWDILPDKLEEYLKWAQGAIQRTLGIPGVVEFRAYRPASGASQVVVTYEFADFAAWAAFYSSEESQKTWDEVRMLTNNLSTELWGPSPVVPQPIRPGG